MSKEITESHSAPASKTPAKGSAKPKRRTDKQRLQDRLAKAGVKGVEKMTVRQLRNELSRIKNEGGEVPDLRDENRGVQSAGKSPDVIAVKEAHLMEEVEVTITDGTGRTRKEKKSTLKAMLDVLRQEGLKNKSVPAIKEYFDRTLGKAKQEVEVAGDIKVEEQRLPTKAEKAAAKAYLAALEDEDDE
jgi:hypothetical protein